MTKNKLKLFEMMGKSDYPILWVHPQSVPFVRSNYPNIPIACALGNMRWWVLNGDNSFYFKNDKYASYKVQVKSEEKIRGELLIEAKHSEKKHRLNYLYYGCKGHYWLKDEINPTIWDKLAGDINELYAHDGMSSYLKEERYNKIDKSNRPSYFLPQGAKIKSLDGDVGTLEYPKTYRVCDKGFHKNLKIKIDDGPLGVCDIDEYFIERII